MNQQSDKDPTTIQSQKKQRRNSSIAKRDIKAIDELCRKGSPEMLAEQYIRYCLEQDQPRLPNIAGFFRWMELSAAARDHFKKNHPDRFQTIKMFFEDEALNSPLPPSIVSSYMKQYFTNERDDPSPSADEGGSSGITLLFEHDIERDGE